MDDAKDPQKLRQKNRRTGKLGQALRGNLAKRKAGGATQTDAPESLLRRTDKLAPKLGSAGNSGDS